MITDSASKTEAFGEKMGFELSEKRGDGALVIGLMGDLGGGKTTFLKGFAKGLGVKDPVLSPTFNIFRRYELKNGRFKRFYHFDCYRIESEQEILDLGFGEMVSNPDNIIAIEWSEMIEGILPGGTVRIEFEFIDETTRRISID